MQSIDRPLQIQSTIRSYLGTAASGLTQVSEIESIPQDEAIRKLQIQIFALSDALSDLAKRVEELSR